MRRREGEGGDEKDETGAPCADKMEKDTSYFFGVAAVIVM